MGKGPGKSSTNNIVNYKMSKKIEVLGKQSVRAACPGQAWIQVFFSLVDGSKHTNDISSLHGPQ